MAGEVWISGQRGWRAFQPTAEQGAFLKQEELQDGTALGLFAVRATRVGEHPVYVIGGRRLDKTFLSGLDMPVGMRALAVSESRRAFLSEVVDRSFCGFVHDRTFAGKAGAADRCGAAVSSKRCRRWCRGLAIRPRMRCFMRSRCWGRARARQGQRPSSSGDSADRQFAAHVC